MVDHATLDIRNKGLTINLEDVEMPSNAEAKEAVKILIRSGWEDSSGRVDKLIAEHKRKERKMKAIQWPQAQKG